jgi:carbonic anhydrase
MHAKELEMYRRDFLLTGASIAAPLSFSDSEVSQESTTGESLSPDDALKQLIEGNERFVNSQSKYPRMSIDWLKRLKKEGQKPVATILACSDSRVPLALLFDQGFGDIFSVRVAGNVVTRFGIGSMQYASHHLDTPLFMVLGHQGCGAVSAALLSNEKRANEPKGIQELLDKVDVGKVDPKADEKTKLNAAIEANVRSSARQIWNLDAKAEGYFKQPNRMLVSAIFDFSTGRVRVLDKLK